jgi:hypothetical protein
MTTTTTAPGLTACRDHRSAAGVTLVIGSPEEAAALLARPGMSAQLRATWASGLSMGHTPFCCPASAYARDVTAAAFRARAAAVPEPEGEFGAVPSITLTGCALHAASGTVDTPAKARSLVANWRRDGNARGLRFLADFGHEVSMGAQGEAGQPCCPAAAYARELMAAALREE